MVDKFANELRLSDFNQRRIRDTKCFFLMDENSGPNDLEQHRIKDARRRMGVSRQGNQSLYSLVNDCDYQKFNNIKENRLPHPYRDYDSTLDPKSHFYTPGYSKSRHVRRIPDDNDNLVKIDPQNLDSLDRKSEGKICPDGLEEIRRKRASGVLQYNGFERKLDECRTHTREKELKEIICRSVPKIDNSNVTFISNAFPEFTSKNNSKATKEELETLEYQYTTITQNAHDDIPFDNYLNPRRWSLESALHGPADPIRSATIKKRWYPAVNDWSNGTNIYEYEATQLRPNIFLPKLPHDFCSIYPRIQQIPSYSGCTGSYKKSDIDNPYKKNYKPFSVVRNESPKFGNCPERPVFIGYTGKLKLLTDNRKDPFHTDPTIRNIFGQAC